MNWLFRNWSSLNWSGQRDSQPSDTHLRHLHASGQEEGPTDSERRQWRREFWIAAGVYAVLILFGVTVPDSVYQHSWARAFSQAMTAVTPQITNIEAISGTRYGQNQFLFAVLWVLAIPICAALAFFQSTRRLRLPLLREQPWEFLKALGGAMLVLAVCYLVVFTPLELGPSRISYVLLSRLSAAIAAPFFVFGPLISSFVFANYLVRLAFANLFRP